MKYENRELEYRKEKYPYVAQFYEDDETHEQFTTTEMDEANLAQVYNQYRVAHSIPFTDEITALREKYGLSALKMSAILGFGDNQYRQYEEGHMPSETNGKILKACQNPAIFETFVRNSRVQLGEKAYTKIAGKLEDIKRQPADVRRTLIFGDGNRTKDNGFAPMSPERLRSILLYFIHECGGVSNTRMNRLLFYTDFCHYRQHGQAMSGLSYKAIKYGPVPVHWDRAYSLFDDVQQEIVEFDTGITGTKLVATSRPDMGLFSEAEKDTLGKIAEAFADTTAGEISLVSHDEEAWKRYVGTPQLINFNTAFDLKAVPKKGGEVHSLREVAMPEKKEWRNGRKAMANKAVQLPLKCANASSWVSLTNWSRMAGSICLLPRLAVICKCSPVARPVLPLMATTSPGLTFVPFRTKALDKWQ